MFTKAEKKKSKLRLALTGPSGSGKTYSALRIATGIGGKIALIDTEGGSSDLYADKFDFDNMQLNNFSPEKYVNAINFAEKSGYNVLIIDSYSHAWNGIGGVLDIVESATQASKSKNSFQSWAKATPKHNLLVNAILQSKMHIIATMRTKTAFDMIEINGKKTPTKIGLAPIQKDGVEYEFTIVFDLNIEDHKATCTKDRSSIFDGRFFVPDENVGIELLEWLESGISEPTDQEKTEKFIVEIGAADNEIKLKTIYQDAFRWAKTLQDKSILDIIINAYTTRKELILNANAEVVEQASENEPEILKSA
jgi:hypothetical protein